MFSKAAGEFSIVKCLNCNLIYTNPRPTSKVLDILYSDIIRYYNNCLDEKQIRNLFFSLNREILSDFFRYPLLRKNNFRKFILFPYYLHFRKK